MGTSVDPIAPDSRSENVLVDCISVQPEKWALDLFSGTGSVTDELTRLVYSVVSLDSDPHSNATIQCDAR